MPVLFVGHGTPMNAIEDNKWSRGFQNLASLIPKPKAILSISAHWFLDETLITSNLSPRTIHDFGGFPDELYEIQYPVNGDPILMHKVIELIGKNKVIPNDKWGIDHGSWSVLRRMYPKADHPTIQLSINYLLSNQEHYEMGKALSSLRKEGYLIIGTGNITHNLNYAFSHIFRGDNTTPDWAIEFDNMVEDALVKKQHLNLINALDTNNGMLSHPTPDHYLPLLYCVGASVESDIPEFPIMGFDLGSLSMRAVLFNTK